MPTRLTLTQRADLTYKANKNAGRHGWLRLTPAYSLKIVQDQLAKLPRNSVVLEPFSGSGTTPLVAQEFGITCEAREINPFLVWFGNTKLDEYSGNDAKTFASSAHEVIKASSDKFPNDYWIPNLFQIEKWWTLPTLQALSALKHHINNYNGKVRNLLDVAFCRVLISSSNAAFNHQSMSFKAMPEYAVGLESTLFDKVLAEFEFEAKFILDTLCPLSRNAKIYEGDSTKPFDKFEPADLVITSPPYANRMSYIREMRPYMYWLGFLNSGSAAGELDWKTTGGTWGSASTKLKSWTPTDTIPIDSELNIVCEKILTGKSGEILSPYVRKYFHDMWSHFKEIKPVVKKGGRLCYIVGNSTFSGYEVPTHEWYAAMMNALGFNEVHINTIHKRNSNKKLFEYAVCATRP